MVWIPGARPWLTGSVAKAENRRPYGWTMKGRDQGDALCAVGLSGLRTKDSGGGRIEDRMWPESQTGTSEVTNAPL